MYGKRATFNITSETYVSHKDNTVTTKLMSLVNELVDTDYSLILLNPWSHLDHWIQLIPNSEILNSYPNNRTETFTRHPTFGDESVFGQ